MTRVALYARYSSDNQREASIEDQFRICREQAKREKWKVVGARVAWDNTAKEVNTPAAGRFPIGTAVEAAGNGVTSVAVRLDGVATAAA